MGVIYALVEPNSERYYYIGKTTDESRRQDQHLRTNPRHETREYLEQGLNPTLKILARYYDIDLDLAEKAWINRAYDQGHKLTNTALSGVSVNFTSDDDDYTVTYGGVTVKLKQPEIHSEYIVPSALTDEDIKVLMHIFRHGAPPRIMSRMEMARLTDNGYITRIGNNHNSQKWLLTEAGNQFCRSYIE